MQALSFKNKEFKLKEPFDGLFTQGMVCHETYKDQKNNWLSPDEVYSDDGKNFFNKKDKKETVIVGPTESMSKSKKNTIDPENIIKDFGADAVRLFILSDSPPEKDVQWSDQGMIASYKFVQKLWFLNSKILEKIENKENSTEKSNLPKFTNQLIDKITNNLEKFHYNVIVANLYEMYNFFIKEIEKPISKDILISNYTKILTMMIPFIPHLANECLTKITNINEVRWPVADANQLGGEFVNFVLQINGKKKTVFQVSRDLEEKEIITIIEKNENISKIIDKKLIKRVIFIPNRLINIIL